MIVSISSLLTAAVFAVVALVLAGRSPWLITMAATAAALLVAMLFSAGIVHTQLCTWVLGIAFLIAAFNVIKCLGGTDDLTRD